MVLKDLDEEGLPVQPARQKRGLLSVQMSNDGWTKLIALRDLWNKGRNRPLSISDVVRACVEKAAKAELESL